MKLHSAYDTCYNIHIRQLVKFVCMVDVRLTHEKILQWKVFVMDYFEIFEKIKLNSIPVTFDSSKQGIVGKGMSKFGGKPDLPEDFQWYYHTGKSYFTECTAHRPLSFLAQINCEEIKEYDIDRRLPQYGMIYFFYDIESMALGQDLQDRGSARVYYFCGNVSELKQTDFPEDLREALRLPEARLCFSHKYDLPDCEEYDPEHYMDLWEEYQADLESAGYVQDNDITKLLGYADTIQGDMTRHCEEIYARLTLSKGQNTGTFSSKDFYREAGKWKLLFQLDSVSLDQLNLTFGDSGKIYYFIREDDLWKKDFSKVWLVFQRG